MMLDFSEEYVLENEFVRLIPLSTTHIDDLVSISLQNDIWKYSFLKGRGREQLQSYVDATLDSKFKGLEYPFAVFDKKRNTIVGSTRLYEFIPLFESIRIGYTWYCEKSRGTKVNKSCKYLLFQFLFEDVGVNRIGLGTYAENKVSIKAIERVYCRFEGRIREYLPGIEGQGRSDAMMYSMLKKEWRANKEKLSVQIKT